MNRHAAKRIELMNYALGALAGLVAVFLCTQPQVVGLCIGALLGALNFSAIRKIVEIQTEAQKLGKPAKHTLLVFPKMMALVAALALAVFFLPISVPFLALGFSIFMLSIAIETARYLTSRGVGETDDTGASTNG